jgi:hypothetical protein
VGGWVVSDCGGLSRSAWVSLAIRREDSYGLDEARELIFRSELRSIPDIQRQLRFHLQSV